MKWPTNKEKQNPKQGESMRIKHHFPGSLDKQSETSIGKSWCLQKYAADQTKLDASYGVTQDLAMGP